MRFAQILPAQPGLHYIEVNTKNLNESKVYPVMCWAMTHNDAGESKVIGLTTPSHLLKNNPDTKINDFNSLVPVPFTQGIYMTPEDDVNLDGHRQWILNRINANNLKAAKITSREAIDPILVD